MRALDLVGRRFDRLVVIARAESDGHGQSRWHCQCDCGAERTILGSKLNGGRQRSCGCWRASGAPRRRHGQAAHVHDGRKQAPEYRIWTGILTRCNNPHFHAYARYGGRGITVCDRWRTFENFLSDMGPRPSPKHSVDRFPNNDGNYEPGNCRWATAKEQAWSLRKPMVSDGAPPAPVQAR